MASMPYVAEANYNRLRTSLGSLEKALERAEYVRLSMASGEFDYTGIEDLAKDDLEHVEQEIADVIAKLVCEYTNILNSKFGERLSKGLAADHPTLLANVLRSVLMACEIHSGDGRLPEWCWTGPSNGHAVPLI